MNFREAMDFLREKSRYEQKNPNSKEVRWKDDQGNTIAEGKFEKGCLYVKVGAQEFKGTEAVVLMRFGLLTQEKTEC